MSKSKTLILKEKTKIRSTSSADSTCVTKKARTIWKRSKKRSTTWMMPPSKLKRALVMNSNFSLESVLLQLMKKVQLPTCRNCKKRSKMSLTRNKTNWKTWKVKWKLSKHSYMPNLAAPLIWKKMHEVICRNFKLKTINLLNYFQKAYKLFPHKIQLLKKSKKILSPIQDSFFICSCNISVNGVLSIVMPSLTTYQE